MFYSIQKMAYHYILMIFKNINVENFFENVQLLQLNFILHAFWMQQKIMLHNFLKIYMELAAHTFFLHINEYLSYTFFFFIDVLILDTENFLSKIFLSSSKQKFMYIILVFWMHSRFWDDDTTFYPLSSLKTLLVV